MPENNTSESFVNPLTARDWNEEWKRLQQACLLYTSRCV